MTPIAPFRDRRLFGTGLAVAGVVALTLLGSVHHDLVNWDDEQNFLRNPGLHLGLGAHLAWAWKTKLLGAFQPLSWHMLWLQTALAGAAAPAVYHLVSVLLHASIVALVFAAVAAWRAERMSPPRLVATVICALVFALHPLRVEVVAWASTQPYLWGCALGLLSFVFYLHSFHGDPSRRRRLHAVSLAIYAAAALAKVAVCSLPLVLFAIRWNRRESPSTERFATRAWTCLLPDLRCPSGPKRSR